MKILDREWLAAIFDDPEEVEDVIAQGIADICEQLTELRDAVEGSDLERVADLAHRIKGVAANIGAQYIQDCAGRLEHAARKESGDSIAGHFTLLSESVDALCDG